MRRQQKKRLRKNVNGMSKSRLILPRKLLADPAKLTRALVNTLNGVALDIKIDFEVTTQTWDHTPTFTIDSPNAYTRVVSTDDAVYSMLNEGTRAHDIFPKAGGILRFKTPFTSKTLPRQIMSRSGSKGTTEAISKRGVHHPGTAAREWDTTIAAKWDKKIGPIFQRAVDSEV